MKRRIIVSPQSAIVVRRMLNEPFFSEVVSLDENDGPDEVRQKALCAYAALKSQLMIVVQRRRLEKRSKQIRITKEILKEQSGPFYPGPRPDLVSTRPWSQAVAGEWWSLPPGVVARLIRATQK